MKIKTFLLFLCLLSYGFIHAQNGDTLISIVDKEIANRKNSTLEEYSKLEKLKRNVHKARLSGTSKEIYDAYLELYNGYRSFKYDSAYFYLEKAKELAKQMNDSSLMGETKIKESFILLSAGLFTEAFDTIKSVEINQLDNDNKYDFYFTKARSYFDIADYNDDSRFRINYVRKGIFNLEEALKYVDKNSSKGLMASGLKNLKQQNWEKAKSIYLQWLGDHDLSPQLYGVATSSLSYIYDQTGEREKAIKYLALAAISDLRNSIKENIALRNLAIELNEDGELNKANKYVRVALTDAEFYNARHRRNQISAILPIMESAQLYKLEENNKNLENAVILLALFTVISLVFLGIIFKQLKEKKAARKALSRNNERLQQMNLSLIEADTIKQDYITYFLKATSQLIGKMGTLQKNTILKVKTKKPEEILQIVQKYSAKKERAALFHQFDEVFLQLFPSFIDRFNSLFPQDEKRVVKKGELLNTELRIFALYRLGIQDNKQVAEFLDISISTVYSYKTRLKSKSDYREDFESKIMDIKRFA
ncbi:DUF6377 domain-containing protein [Zunongwangia sp. F363]|uniref:DUF6377 domain-containing protein n=1 Tax=Autumnicola tepida TaxID=3075595 RepID=A0ABU3C4K5_9FLAO|nr:DUF6377 domain-containing protein [Zunongwangia sp. F363]MDT0641249.1 DUF6377 domain-containing protein [Zunongwangia sp. F363]